MVPLRRNDRLLLSGLVFFVAGATLLLHSIEAGSESALLTGLAALIVAVVSFAVAALRMWTRVDWQRVDAEQRLWESGPLGRRWLKLRQLLHGDARPGKRPPE